MTLSEFTKIVEEAFMSDQLKYVTHSAAHLDDSIDFYRDEKTGILIIEKSTSTTSNPMLTDRNLRSALQFDAKKLVERFNESYKDNEEAAAINQLLEILEYLVAEN